MLVLQLGAFVHGTCLRTFSKRFRARQFDSHLLYYCRHSARLWYLHLRLVFERTCVLSKTFQHGQPPPPPHPPPPFFPPPPTPPHFSTSYIAAAGFSLRMRSFCSPTLKMKLPSGLHPFCKGHTPQVKPPPAVCALPSALLIGLSQRTSPMCPFCLS